MQSGEQHLALRTRTAFPLLRSQVPKPSGRPVPAPRYDLGPLVAAGARFPPFDVIDAFGMDLGVTVDTNSILEFPAALMITGQNFRCPSTLTFFTTLTRVHDAVTGLSCNIAVIVRPKKNSRKSARMDTKRLCC